MGKPKVTFVVESEDDKSHLVAYAKDRGFSSVGALARFALFQYINRYPMKRVDGRKASRD